MIFLLLITLPLYYLIKGVIVKETRALFIITMIIFGLNVLIAYNMNSGWFRTAVLVYLLYSFADYISLSSFKKPILELPLMSRIRIVSDEAVINYSVLKVFILLPVNIFLLFKKQPVMGFTDEIGVDIRAKDGTKIKINL
ncbi:MAG: hypothetical protein JXN63_05985 [Candidatus Delongbacteria bacterium]|nr:hypothetical protein [Candidatus Delongbacteria bacterium]